MRTRICLCVLMLVATASAHNHRNVLNTATPAQTGIASWYGKREQGKRMANGQPFDRNNYTCASRTYKLGTYLQVTYPKTGITVFVMVTDRGPWVKGRVLDLSERAAKTLGLKPHGVGLVQIEPLYLVPLTDSATNVLTHESVEISIRLIQEVR